MHVEKHYARPTMLIQIDTQDTTPIVQTNDEHTIHGKREHMANSTTGQKGWSQNR
jgi:hypothetical protein